MKRQASTTTLNAKNLKALGARRLAELLMNLSRGNAATKRRLRLELAGAESPAAVAKAVRTQLATIARSSAFVDWQHRRVLVDDLHMQRRAIVDTVAPRDPVEGLDLMWRFLALADSVFARCDDSSGTVAGVFDAAVSDLGQIAQAATPDPTTLADRAFRALTDNGYGQYDTLIQGLTPTLGPEGLEHLKQRMLAWSNVPARTPPDQDRRVIGYGSSGPIDADDLAERSRTSTVRLALMQIADAQGDVDAFIAQYDAPVRQVPTIAAAIARRLCAADRAEEALQVIDAADRRVDREEWPTFEWEDARIEVLDTLNRGDETQAVRWSCFERALSIPHLRAYLTRLPDVEDVDAEERALDDAERYTSPLVALAFLVSWPALDRAAALTIRQVGDLDGHRYEILAPAAEALADTYPLAATLVLRSMIDAALTHRRSSRYHHAARHLKECARLASAIEDFETYEPHDVYDARLRREHGKKSSFWRAVR